LTTTCIVCRRDLRDHELGNKACQLCEQRTDQNLRALAGPQGLYAQLDSRLAPGAGNGGPAVSGSRTAPVPVRLDVLNLMTDRGPILATLETWVRDWEEAGHAVLCEAGTLQQRVDHAVNTLRFNLGWAAREHNAFDEFAREIGQARRQCEVQVTGEKQPRVVPVACSCGQTLRITLDTVKVVCPACAQQYGHSEALSLPLAERAAA
jgi:hypothetical protein